MTLSGLLSSSDPRPTVNSGNGTVADCMPPTQGLASWQQALIWGSGSNQNETLVFYFSPIFFFFLVGENSLLQLSRMLEVDRSKKSGFPSKAFPPWKNRELGGQSLLHLPLSQAHWKVTLMPGPFATILGPQQKFEGIPEKPIQSTEVVHLRNKLFRVRV